MVDTVIKHDPKGLVQHDMKYLRSIFKEKRYSPKDTHGDIMFREGQQQVLDFIERELIAKR